MSFGGPQRAPGSRFVSRGKADSFWDAWKRLFRYMSEYRTSFIIAIVASAICAVTSVLGPHYLSLITNEVEKGLTAPMDADSVMVLVTILSAIYVFGGFLSFLDNYCMATVSQKTASRFRKDIARKINKLPLKYFDGHRTGDILSRITNDVDNISQSMDQGVTTLVSSVTLFTGALLMMFVTDVSLALISLATTLLGIIIMKILMSRSQKYFVNQQRDLGNMNSHVSEIYSGHVVVKAFGGEQDSLDKFREINSSLSNSAFKSQFIGRVMIPVTNFTGNLGYAAVCIFGAVMYINGSISFGTIVAFMFYVRMISRPMNQISEALISMQSVAASAERVFEFIDEAEMDPETGISDTLEHVSGRVEFKNVHFGYEPGREVICGFSATVEPGQKVAIVGPTGAGKTTIVNLLMRFYDVSDGDILIDGISVRSLTRKNIRSMFGMVLQDSWIFEGTIRENIIYCKEGVTDADLDKVCEASGLSHFIETLPKGYDTRITESTALSVGQKQQITIARAMIQDSPMLILDEATSSVDTRTEKTIQNAMDSLTAGRTSFVIAHRLSTIRNADLIIVMRHGTICEQGTHDELIASGGFYKELYDSQFSD